MREYAFSKNIFTKIWGMFFRSVLHKVSGKVTIRQAKTPVSTYSPKIKDYAGIYNKQPNGLVYYIWRKILSPRYTHKKQNQVSDLKRKLKAIKNITK